jgi:hypothetical protein
MGTLTAIGCLRLTRLAVRLIPMRRVPLPGQMHATFCWRQCFQAVVPYRSGLSPLPLPPSSTGGHNLATACKIAPFNSVAASFHYHPYPGVPPMPR